MSEHKKPQPSHEQDDAVRENHVYRTIHTVGWVVPETEQDVAQAEAALSATPDALPDALQHPDAIFNRPTDHNVLSVRPLTGPPPADTHTNLARAARQGGPIPPEIEQRMQRDRQDAENAMDVKNDGQTDR